MKRLVSAREVKIREAQMPPPTADSHSERISQLYKQTIECRGRKIRMEFYLGHEPLNCPGCGEDMRGKCAACGKELPIHLLKPCPRYEGFERDPSDSNLGCESCLAHWASKCCVYSFHADGDDHSDDCENGRNGDGQMSTER